MANQEAGYFTVRGLTSKTPISTINYGVVRFLCFPTDDLSSCHSHSLIMADVDMPDAGPSAPAPSKAPQATKPSKSGAHTDAGADGKKRFEVKKVSPRPCYMAA